MSWKIKMLVEDFFVKEVYESNFFNACSNSGEYVWFWIRKKDWDMYRLLRIMAKRLGVSVKRFGYAGVKDKRAVTEQLISVWNVDVEKINGMKIRDVDIWDIRRADRGIKLGDNNGNFFRIVVRSVSDKCLSRAEVNIEHIRKNGMINLFGKQRFGSLRSVTAEVGEAIVRGDLKKAAMLYLTKTGENEPDETKKARKRLADEMGFREALKYFPQHLKFEIAMLNHLAKHEHDFAGALRKIPKHMRKMFVHAYQARLWNEIAMHAWESGIKCNTIPLIGYESDINSIDSSELRNIIKQKLSKENISTDDFKISSMPEMSARGEERKFIVIPSDFSYDIEDDELNKGMKKIVLSFFLPKGCYATALVEQIMADCKSNS